MNSERNEQRIMDIGVNRNIEIPGLYRIGEDRYEELQTMLLEAFENYPKLQFAFPDPEKRAAAIEMVLRFYGAYDLAYGAAYSLDNNINEAVIMLHSDFMGYSDDMVESAVCNGEPFKKAASRLSSDEISRWEGFFEELDRQEAFLDLPKPYLYLDFVAVRKGFQGSGRGSKIIQKVCEFAREKELPVMLFTNGDEHVEFYLNNGFRIIGVTRSEEYGFENTYMWYDSKNEDR